MINTKGLLFILAIGFLNYVILVLTSKNERFIKNFRGLFS